MTQKRSRFREPFVGAWSATRVVKAGIVLIFLFTCIPFEVLSQEPKITITGKLIRVMAIGGESTGWAIQLESKLDINGKQVDTLEVVPQADRNFVTLQDKRVRATGKLSYRKGVETGRRSVLNISSLQEVKPKRGRIALPTPAVTTSFSLTGSKWLLEDLSGNGVVENVQATLAFPQVTKVAGHGSCNRFFGPAKINGSAIHLGPLGSTRMACAEAVMNQETKYLNALQAAEHFEWKKPYLMLYCKGFEKPLRFIRKEAEKPAVKE